MEEDYGPVINMKNRTLIRKYPAYRDSYVNGSWKWIEGKRKDDYAEGFWRIHDKLYDLTDFITKHPGGKYWLEITKVRRASQSSVNRHRNEFDENEGFAAVTLKFTPNIFDKNLLFAVLGHRHYRSFWDSSLYIETR